MSPGLKRILLIIALLTVAGLIAFGMYYLFRTTGTTKGPIGKPRAGGPAGQLPGAGERVPGAGGVTPGGGAPPGLPTAGEIPGAPPSYFTPEPVSQVSPDAAIFPSMDTQGDMRYHNAGDGKFYQILPDGTTKAMSDQVFYNVQNVTWAKPATKRFWNIRIILKFCTILILKNKLLYPNTGKIFPSRPIALKWRPKVWGSPQKTAG